MAEAAAEANSVQPVCTDSRGLALFGPYPQPARGSPMIALSIPTTVPAPRLEVYDLAGRRVANRDLSALGTGRHLVSIGTGSSLASGVYLIQLVQGEQERTARAVVTR